MPTLERVREPWSGPLTADHLEQKAQAGWKLAAVEWTRPASGDAAAGPKEEVPYGLQVANDCLHLEENPAEKQVLLVMMNWIVEDGALSQIADDLNRRGFRTRGGAQWGPDSVFHLLPRLIEFGARIFDDPQWVSRRRQPVPA